MGLGWVPALGEEQVAVLVQECIFELGKQHADGVPLLHDVAVDCFDLGAGAALLLEGRHFGLSRHLRVHFCHLSHLLTCFGLKVDHSDVLLKPLAPLIDSTDVPSKVICLGENLVAPGGLTVVFNQVNKPFQPCLPKLLSQALT